MNSRVSIFYGLAVTALLASVVVSGTLAVTRLDYVNHVSGAWMALAMDLLDGEFYRPLFDSSGMGGTRFMPLHFVLQAILMKAGLGILASGYMITFVFSIALVAGVYSFLRIHGIDAVSASFAAAACLALETMQFGMVTIRGDMLAAALNIWGVNLFAFYFYRMRKNLLLYAACGLFVLAFAAKITTVFGASSCLLLAMLSGKKDKGLRFAAFTIIPAIVMMLIIHYASEGRALENFIVCSFGGTSMADVLNAPVQMISSSYKFDKPGLFLWLISVGVLFSLPRRSVRELPVIFYFLSLIFLLFIYSANGTTWNHQLDFSIAALVLTVSMASKAGVSKNFISVILAVLCVAGAAGMSQRHKVRDDEAETIYKEIVERVKRQEALVLAEDPMVPVLAGRRPYMLDPFMFRIIAEQYPQARDLLFAKIERKEFSMVVLNLEPDTRFGEFWYSKMHFGPGFYDVLKDNYYRVPAPDLPKVIYVPIMGRGHGH